jgi:hypothetical protein
MWWPRKFEIGRFKIFLCLGINYTMSQTTSQFWNWFKQHQDKLTQINNPNLNENDQEELLDSILEQLHLFCDKLYFDLGGLHGESQEFVITAEGDVDYFDKVEELIEAAPDLKGWSFIAFMPARGLGDTTVFEDVELKPFEMWFLPLDNKNKPKSLGFRICLPNYELVKNSKWLKAAVYKVLDTALGEKVFAMDIDYIEIKELPHGDLEAQGLLELKDLSAFVKWKKKKLAAL